MSKDKTKIRTGGIGFLGSLTILFIGLKLTGHITWSWLWVLSPLWLPISAFFTFLALLFIPVFVWEWIKDKKH